MDKLLLAVKILITLLVLILFVQNIVLVEVQFLVWSVRLGAAVAGDLPAGYGQRQVAVYAHASVTRRQDTRSAPLTQRFQST